MESLPGKALDIIQRVYYAFTRAICCLLIYFFSSTDADCVSLRTSQSGNGHKYDEEERLKLRFIYRNIHGKAEDGNVEYRSKYQLAKTVYLIDNDIQPVLQWSYEVKKSPGDCVRHVRGVQYMLEREIVISLLGKMVGYGKEKKYTNICFAGR